MNILYLHIVCLFFSLTALPRARAQAEGNTVPALHVKKATGQINLDGILDEKEWEMADVATDFWQYFPFDTLRSKTKSEVRITYDKQFLYVGFTVRDPVAGPWVTTSLRRDFRGNHNDVISVIFDPFSDQTNGMLFGINPFGVQREGLLSGISGNTESSVSSQSSTGFDLSWDNKWYSATQTYDGYWTAELAIPFKTLRYKEGSKVWKVNFYRLDSKTAERSTWGHIPRNQNIFSLAYSGDLIFDEPLKKPGANIALIPYVSGLTSKDFLEGTDTEYAANVGGDVKIGVTPSLNLDLTFNPDFSQVEADVQQANLTRFELFFPERRQFFLENQDIFASFGASSIRPFFSRRIGIAEDPGTGLNVQNKIHFGARLSGRIDQNWRIGAMNMQTAKDASIYLPGFNYSVLALQRQLFARSNISVIGINKQATSTLDTDLNALTDVEVNNYNRLVGIDYNLASQNNRWNGKFFYHHSFSPQNKDKTFAHGAQLIYNAPAVKLEWNHQVVGENYNPEVGFTPRTGYNRLAPGVQFVFYPNKKLASHGPGIETEYIWNQQYGKTDHRFTLFYELNFSNTTTFKGGIQNEYTYLFQDFDPTRSEGVPLPENSEYNYTSFVAELQSDRRKDFYYNMQALLGQFFNGDVINVSGDLNYRYQHLGTASLNFSYSKIMLPEPYTSGSILLLGPRFDITFSKKVFLTTFFQYNDQIDNVNINARLQYRFKPVSDIFLVYTDNYYASDFTTKNRAIVAKITYWLNI